MPAPVGQVQPLQPGWMVQLCCEQLAQQEHKFPAENAHCRVFPACALPRISLTNPVSVILTLKPNETRLHPLLPRLDSKHSFFVCLFVLHFSHKSSG